eukprot:4938491-Pyramimonas_sp.AAC.1
MPLRRTGAFVAEVGRLLPEACPQVSVLPCWVGRLCPLPGHSVLSQRRGRSQEPQRLVNVLAGAGRVAAPGRATT